MTVEYKVEITDIDYMGHVSHYKWFEIMEKVRFAMLEKLDWPLSKAWNIGVGAVIAEAAIAFKKPAKYGDSLKVRITPCEAFKYGCSLHFEIFNQHEILLIDCKQKALFIDLKEKRPTSIPNDLAAKLGL
ncbi:MAG: acyl-CoA thioesterase [Oligoflexales bacterium]